MNSLLALLNVFDNGSRTINHWMNFTGLPSGAIPILIILAVIGASYLNSLAGRRRSFDTAVSVSCMLIGAFVANGLAGHVRLPLDGDVMVSAVVGMFGMTIVGLMLLFAYRRSEY
jgi:hypothetical protein